MSTVDAREWIDQETNRLLTELSLLDRRHGKDASEHKKAAIRSCLSRAISEGVGLAKEARRGT